MILNIWLPLCSMLLVAASLPAICRAQPDALPPPPAGLSQESPSDVPSAPTTAQKQFQAPTQAPMPAPSKEVPAAPQVVTCTIMVPQMTYKTVTVPDVVCRPETRQKNVSVCRLVPETTMVTKIDTVVVPERRTTTRPETVCRMTYETVSKQITVMVPRTEMRQGTRTVCKPVAVQEMQTVCKEVGGWAQKSNVDCCGCTQTCQVWQCQTVTEQVPVTVYKPHFEQVPYSYPVTVCHPETRTITEQVAKPVYETQMREVSCLVPVTKQVERQVPQTTMRPVVENRTVNYTVMVPQRIDRQVTVPVCTLVPKQVSYTVQPCAPCQACGW